MSDIIKNDPLPEGLPGGRITQDELDERYMRRAVELAKRGAGRTNPNPMVGAVIVKDGEVIGEGWHERYGELHAERNALKNCRERGNDPEGAAIYVTLEPCCHYGKTPPCTEALIEAKIARVVIGSFDPNPKVAGKGTQILRDAGMEVKENVLRDACDAFNYVFLHYITTGTPYVIMKYAMTADGKICTATGKSRWVTGGKAREHTHRDRDRYAAIMVGIGTVLADDPLLTCRTEGGRNPVRVICDTSLRMPMDSQIVRTAKDVPSIIATAVSDEAKLAPFREAGCEIITIPKHASSIDLKLLMKELGDRKIDSVILEGGATLNAAALKAGIVNRVQAYIAPKIFGGETAKTPVAGEGVDSPSDAYMLGEPSVTYLGGDILLESEVIRCSQES
ncbi:MAG: bifunctional diaminohydroxyphosphoribosylaminopyrimidine deaminase/5-amino-6-(5-phosphoribosylamino)uracil reductase RibD [Lachnospiraceae bacterium]|nr:bifunctional diaminohydroxyphosphoribosylaminopyrimidine deaminase/5-amino-6-(5-phosphoribosylamino)uracil reductase RibD [Lachnospiraceae bacterium]